MKEEAGNFPALTVSAVFLFLGGYGLHTCMLKNAIRKTIIPAILLGFLLPPPQIEAGQLIMPYPGRDSVILNPFDPADESALLLQAMQPVYRAETGRGFSIREQPGRGGVTAMASLESLPKDGYTIALVNIQNLVLRTLDNPPTFKLTDFSNLCLIAEMPLVLWTAGGSELRDIRRLVEKAGSDPDTAVAGAGTGSVSHLATLELNRLAGIKTIFRPYSGTQSGMQACLLGNAAVFWGYTTPHLRKDEKCRALAVAAETRHPALPDVPTFAELGIDLFVTVQFGLVIAGGTDTTAGMPAAAIFLTVARRENFQNSLRGLGFTPLPAPASAMNDYLKALQPYLAEKMEDYGLR